MLLLVVSWGVGCARSTPSTEAANPDGGRREPGDALLITLREKRDELLAEVDAAERAAEQFRAQHPESFAVTTLVPQQLQQVSQAYVNAQLATINAKAQYAAGHPVLAAAQRREKELRERYDLELTRAVEHQAKLAAYQKLQYDIVLKQDMARRLNVQIMELEVASASETSRSR
jgi:hypothetical protein